MAEEKKLAGLTFSEQVDAVLNGANTESSHLEVMKQTPPILRVVGLQNLPILMRADKLRGIIQDSGTASMNYHGLGPELVKQLPEHIADPVMIMDSISPNEKAKNNVVIVTQMVDKENHPVIGAIRLASPGNDLNGFEITANILASAYGKDNFQSFIERNIEQGSILYIDKEKSQELFETPGIQFPNNLESLSFNTIIRKSKAFVNSEEEEKSEKSENEQSDTPQDDDEHERAFPGELKEITKKNTEKNMKVPTTEAEIIAQARERARRLTAETGEPYVTIEWSESSELKQGDVMPLSEADDKLFLLDSVFDGRGYDKVQLDIDYVLDGKPDSYEACRFDIGTEKNGLVGHIQNYWDYFSKCRNALRRTDKEFNSLISETEKDEVAYMADVVAPYFRQHLKLSNMVTRANATDFTADELAEVKDYVTHQRAELNGLPILETVHAETNDVVFDKLPAAAPENPSAPLNYRDKVASIRDEMAQTLLDYIEKNPTEWQSGWNNLTAPVNGKTNKSYRGFNSLYLSLIGAERGYDDPRWVTFSQAKDLGASIKKGEKSSPVLFFEFYDRLTKKAYDARTTKDMTDEERAAYEKENVYAVLKYSSVFNASQCANFPERDLESLKMSEADRANQNELIETIIANSAAPVKYDGGNRAYYSPATDSIHLPAIEAFNSMQDYYATALHEIAHSTGHPSRLNRDMSGKFGHSGYAIEELRAELACVYMQIEQGIQLEGKHIENHAAYLNSWLAVVKDDKSVFFKAASDAQKIADYVSAHYLQSVQVAEQELQEEKEKSSSAEKSPMAEYLRSEQDKLENEQKYLRIAGLQMNVRDWYLNTFPDDEFGNELDGGLEFQDVIDALNKGENIYDVLGVEDSIVRERIFWRIAELEDKSYEEIYDAYMNVDEQGEHEKENTKQQTNTENSKNYLINFTLNYSNELLLSRALEEIGYKKDLTVTANNNGYDEMAVGQGLTRWSNDIAYNGADGKRLFGTYFRESKFGGVIIEATEIFGFMGMNLTAAEAEEVANIIRDFGVNVEVKEMSSNADANEETSEQGEHEEESIEEARARAKRLAQETGEPYVTFEWSERSKGFPDMQENTVMPLSVADKKFAELDAEALSREVVLKANLYIDYVFKGELNSYENLRFYIGSENGGIVKHVEDYSKNDNAVKAHFISVAEQQELKELTEYFKRHIRYSQDESMPEEMRLHERSVINSALPLPLQRELEAEDQGEHEEKSVQLGSDILYARAIFSNDTPRDIQTARSEAKKYSRETGEPYITIEHTEQKSINQNQPWFERGMIIPLGEADKFFENINADFIRDGGHAEVNINFDFVFENQEVSIPNFIYEFGSAEGGIITAFEKYAQENSVNTNLTVEHRRALQEYSIYFKQHKELSDMEDKAIKDNLPIEEQYDIQGYTLAARKAVNTSVPFAMYKLPTPPSELKKARDAAHAAGLPFSSRGFYDDGYSADEDFDPYVYDGSMSVEDYNKMWELRKAGEKELTVEEARNAMLDAHVKDKYHYAVRIEDMPYKDPIDGFESEKPAQNIYVISNDGTIDLWRTEPLDSYISESTLPYGYNDKREYERVEYDELSRIAEQMRAPMQKYMDVLKAEDESNGKRIHNQYYYLRRAMDVLDEHYNAGEGAFVRQLDNPKYLSKTTYADQTRNGYQVMSISPDENGRNIAVIHRRNDFMVGAGYNTDDGTWAQGYYGFKDQKSAEEFRQQNYPSGEHKEKKEVSSVYQKYREAQRQFPNAFILQRVGDFYEVIGESAKEVAQHLGLTLTERDVGLPNRVPMAGVPNYAIGSYADQLRKFGDVALETDDGRFVEMKQFAEQAHEQTSLFDNGIQKNTVENTFCTDFGGEYIYFLVNDGLSIEDICKEYASNPRDGFGYRFGRQISEGQYKEIQDKKKGFNIDFLDDINAFTISQDGKVIESGYLYEDLVLKYQEQEQTSFDNINDNHEAAEQSKNYELTALNIIKNAVVNGEALPEVIAIQDKEHNYGFNVKDLTLKHGGKVDGNEIIITPEFMLEIKKMSNEENRTDKTSVQNRTDNRTVGEELSNSSHWLKVNLPEGAVGKKYGENTLIKMPEGEYSYFGLFIPTKFLHQTNGKWQLNLGSNFNYRIENDGRRVELTGQELHDSFAGMQIGKKPVRVAPSRAQKKVFDDLEKNVPEEMKAFPNWCVYRTFQREDKDKKGKVLKSALTGEGASSKNPGDWTDFKTAIEYAKKNGFAGVSFLLEAKNGITCIDLDECVKNAETGEMKERAAKLTDSLKGTYMERSTSGNGVHIFIKDDILKNGKYSSTSVDAQKGDLEVYDNNRVISMTGNMFSETNALTRASCAATMYLRAELGEQKQKPQTAYKQSRPSSGTNMSDSELLSWIRGSKKGKDFDDLYSGKGVSGNKSNDDAKLAHLLLYFSGGDKEQTFRIMRESGINRADKPDSYYRHTIEEMDKRIGEYAKRPKPLAADGAGKKSRPVSGKKSSAQA